MVITIFKTGKFIDNLLIYFRFIFNKLKQSYSAKPLKAIGIRLIPKQIREYMFRLTGRLYPAVREFISISGKVKTCKCGNDVNFKKNFVTLQKPGFLTLQA